MLLMFLHACLSYRIILENPKSSSSYVFLLYSDTYITHNHTPCHTPASPDIWVIFPHQATLCDISWVSLQCNSFWHCVPGDSIRAHRLRAQSHEIALTPLQMSNSSIGYHLSSDPPTINWMSAVSRVRLHGFLPPLQWPLGASMEHQGHEELCLMNANIFLHVLRLFLPLAVDFISL